MSQYTLLFVDDEQDILDNMRRTFYKDYQVITASSGKDALHILDTTPVDVIVCDQRMPEITGDVVLRHAHLTQPECIRILLTGYSDMESLIRAVNDAQIYKYLAKPWEPEFLRLTVVRSLESMEMRRQLRIMNAALQDKEQQLVKALQQAEQANFAKSQFLSLMSHELRTPMNAILGFSQLMELDAALNDDQKENVAAISDAGKQLLQLINDILDLSEIVAGRMDLTMEDWDIHSILRECLDLTAHNAEQKQLSIQPLSADESLTVHADRKRLKQVLVNLISNAIKYNHQGGSISISWRVLDHALKISVADTGPGIALERQSDLFKPFNRLGMELSVAGGTGIGLAIAKGLVEMMNGSIGVDSAPGKGSTFWIIIPQTATSLHRD